MFKNIAISRLSDKELLLLYQKSEKRVYLGELFMRYLPLLYGVCLKYLKDARHAQDAVIHVFEDLFYKISDYRINEFRSWIYGYTKNYCLQVVQKRKSANLPAVRTEYENAVLELEYDNLVVMSGEEDQEELQTELLVNCLNELPEEERTSLIYFFVDELSLAEIVNRTGYSLKHVKHHIQHGKQNLRTHLAKSFQ